MIHHNNLSNELGVGDYLEAKTVRGPQTWAYIYVALGFVFAIEGTIIQMITPLVFPWNIFAYIVAGVVTFWIFLCSEGFQSKLIAWKNSYENKAR